MECPAGNQEVELTPRPRDGVTSLNFNTSYSSILVASWSGVLSYHSCSTGLLANSVTLQSPVLSATLLGDHMAVGGCLDGSVYVWDLAKEVGKSYSVHATGVRGVAQVGERIATMSWDKTVKLWDPRTGYIPEDAPGVTDAGILANRLAGTINLDGKGFALAVESPASESGVIIVGDSKRLITITDTRKLNSPLCKKVVGAPGQIRSICSLDSVARRYAVGTTHGRVSVEAYATDSGNKDGFSFRCHWDRQRAYPVNGISRVDRGFVTCGGDGYVYRWDEEKRKRVRSWGRFETGVSTVCTSQRQLGIAVSYAFEEGEKDWPQDRILLVDLTDLSANSRTAS